MIWLVLKRSCCLNVKDSYYSGHSYSKALSFLFPRKVKFLIGLSEISNLCSFVSVPECSKETSVGFVFMTWLCFRINGNRSTDDRVALAELPFPFMSWSQARSRQNYPQINNCPSCGIKSLEENLYFTLKSINSP